jgi:uncharacterized protein (TIRG00374 family)
MSRIRKIVSGSLRALIGIALLVYLGSSGSIRWGSLLGLVRAWHLTILALALLLTNFTTTAWRFCILLRPLGLRLSLVDSLKLTLIGQFFSTFLPGGASGDVMKIYYAAKGNSGYRTEVATTVLIDRAVGMFALLLMPLLLVLFFSGPVNTSPALRKILWFDAFCAFLMLCGFLACFSTRVRKSGPLLWIFRVPLGVYVERIFDTIHGFNRNLLRLLSSLGISLLGHVQTITVLLLLAAATVPGEPVWRASMMVPLGLLANTVPLTPGGLGVGEAAFERLFQIAGISSGAESLLAWRVLTTLLSLAGLLFYLKGRERLLHTAEAETAEVTADRV